MRAPFTQLYVHLVWATWDRVPLITPEVGRVVYPALLSAAEEIGVHVIALGGVEDHVHLLVQIPATASVAIVAKQLKGASSHLMNRSGMEWFKWQGGYGAFTVSRWDVPRVRAYVERQREHHQAGTLSRSLEPAPPQGG